MARFVISNYNQRRKISGKNSTLSRGMAKRSFARSDNSSEFMGMMFQQHKDKVQPMVVELNTKLMNVCLDNVKIQNQNKVLIEFIKQQKETIN